MRFGQAGFGGRCGRADEEADNPVGRAIVRHILKGSAQRQLASGVTTRCAARATALVPFAVRDAIDAGKYQGPRLVAPGTGVHGAGRQCRLARPVADSPAEAAEQVRDLYARGADVIKLFVTGGVFERD